MKSCIPQLVYFEPEALHYPLGFIVAPIYGGSARKHLSLDTGMNCVFFLINLLDVFILSIVYGIFGIEVIVFGKRKIHP